MMKPFSFLVAVRIRFETGLQISYTVFLMWGDRKKNQKKARRLLESLTPCVWYGVPPGLYFGFIGLYI